MLFNSYLFLLLFFPLTLLAYYNLPRVFPSAAGGAVLLAASGIFLLYAGWYHLVVLGASVLVNFLVFRAMVRRKDIPSRKRWLLLGLLLNVGALAAFKYGGCLPWRGPESFRIVLPLGISFYTFQQIAFLVDAYRGETESGLTFRDYAAFVSFFPKLLEGPILLRHELLPALRAAERPRFRAEDLAAGLYLFSMGLGKKALAADNFGRVVDYGFSHIQSLNALEAVLAILGYSLQLYFDFSGYCDMAIGAAKMLGLDLPWNFDSPYKAKDISEFWKRWHITLTRFLTKYVYYPLGGNRKGLPRTCLNILIVFLISGLWHGTGYTFLLWGAMHGAASVLYRLFRRPYDRLPAFLRRLLTFVFVTVAWVFFRAASPGDALALLSRVGEGAWTLSVNAELTESLLQPALISAASQFLPFVAVILGLYAAATLLLALSRNTRERMSSFTPCPRSLVFSLVLLLLSVLSLSGFSSFLYVNF